MTKSTYDTLETTLIYAAATTTTIAALVALGIDVWAMLKVLAWARGV